MCVLITILLVLAQIVTQSPQSAGLSNPADVNAKPQEKCSIEGKAANAVTGEPLKKAHITLRGAGPESIGANSSVMSGANGAFTFKDIEAGTYRPTADRTGFAPTAYGAKRPSMGGAEIRLTPGMEMKDIVLRLQPQGVVTGRIADSDGEPVASVAVELIRSVYRNGQRTEAPAGTATDDLGEYRIFGVAAGKYRLRATYTAIGSSGEPQAYAPTYYPGQPDSASAAMLKLQPGETLRGIDMAILQMPTRRVRGRVLLTPGRADLVQVMVTSRDPGSMFNMRRTQGVRPAKPTFEFHLGPGAYNVQAWYNDGGNIVTGTAQVDVGDSDIDNSAIAVQPGGEISGRLRIEGAAGLKALAQSNVRIGLSPKNNAMFFGVPSARVDDDGAFTLKNVGPQTMDIYVTGLPSGYYVKSISYGQQYVKENGLAYTGSNDPVDILISPNGAAVDGVVRNHAGEPVPGATVALVPPPEQRSNARRFRTAQADQAGKFSLKGVEPNEYTVFAWEDIDPGSGWTRIF